MIIGIDCQPKGKNVSFEECRECAWCMPRPMIESILPRPFKSTPNTYSISQIKGCLVCSYYENVQGRYESLQNLYSQARGRSYHNFLYGFSVREMEASRTFQHGDDKLRVMGKLDGYDSETKTLYELKSVVDVSTITYARPRDRIQAQCYGTIFSDIMRIDELRVVYLDADSWKVMKVAMNDMTEFITRRTGTLHDSLKARTPPPPETGWDCRYCGLRNAKAPPQASIMSRPASGNPSS